MNENMIVAAATRVDPTAFRGAMRHVPTPVAIVTTTVRGAPVGLTVGSFTSVSLEPALVTFFVDKSSTTWPRMQDSDTFTVNILGHGKAERCRTFSGKGVDRFAGVDWVPSDEGDPIFADASVVLECIKHSTRWLGDHLQVVGEVTKLHVLREDLPLVYHQGAFLNLDHLVSA
ncbi:flavin reductase family protein [Rhodococcus sp. T2V]|uniref:flavin reductase family protein n=1 Tax=Rhodococcus sp. T2V TaxID=3034164 RepID=UPI0023E24422|nr:flavin reductase family protein [Rhodococcus sp. T2V]MDF3307544.1 flavin reductase family protein [Rhodococcus sp. T2V]